MSTNMDKAAVLAALDNVACGAPAGHEFRMARAEVEQVYAQRDALVKALREMIELRDASLRSEVHPKRHELDIVCDARATLAAAEGGAL